MRNYNNYLGEDDKDKCYLCKDVELIKRLIDGCLFVKDTEYFVILGLWIC